jgi:inositol 3-alpha-galactosyltransferase
MAPEAITEPMNVHRRAYVTFLAGNGDYVKGVVGLAKGLRKAESAYPLVVAILPDVPEDHRQILVSQGCIVREIEPVYPPENQTDYAMAYYVINYSKLRIWEVNLFHILSPIRAILILYAWRMHIAQVLEEASHFRTLYYF